MSPSELHQARTAAGARYATAAAELRAAWIELHAHDMAAANAAAQSTTPPAGFVLTSGLLLEELVHATYLPRDVVMAGANWAGSAAPRAAELLASLNN